MKKAYTLCGAALFACATLTLQAKSSSSYSCALCGVGTSTVEIPTIVKPTPTPTSGCSFCGSGTSSSSGSGSSAVSSANWTRATTRSVYMVTGEGAYAGIATITTGKISKKGKVDVKITFKPAVGKSSTASKTAFTPDKDGTITATWSNVKSIGAVSLTLTTDGEVEGTAGVYEFSEEYDSDDLDDGETFVHGEHTFSVDVDDYELNDDYSFVDETIPSEVAIVTSNSKSWNCGSTPKIKYKKYKEDGDTWYELVGIDDEVKTNYSGLKLKYNSKKGTFSGSFKVYATNEGSTEKKPKLKTYSFSVSGRIAGGVATGVATCKKLKASWEVTIE